MKLTIGILLMCAGFGSAQQAPKPEQQFATVCVYREKATIKGRWIKPSVYSDGTEITRIERGTFFKTTVPAGKHIITLGRTEVGQFLDMEPGKTYYFRFGHKNIVGNAVTGRDPLTLTPVPEDIAVKEMVGLKDTSNLNGHH